MRVVLEDYTLNPERTIARFAAICYGSGVDTRSLDRRIKHLMKVKHLATLRFANATFLVEGVSRACTHQLVRHPHLSYLQESQRYVSQRDTDVVIPPHIDEGSRAIMTAFANSMHNVYDKLVGRGVKKEDARYVLSNGATSSMYITGNFQAWHDFLQNRTDPHAQWEVREVANAIADRLYLIAPNVFEEFHRNEEE